MVAETSQTHRISCLTPALSGAGGFIARVRSNGLLGIDLRDWCDSFLTALYEGFVSMTQ